MATLKLKVLILLLHCFDITRQVIGCSEGWTQVGDRCFTLFHSADFFGFRTVYEARRMCNKYGSDFAALKTSGDHESLFRMVQLLPKDVRPKRVYIGIVDIKEEGKYVWLDGQPVTFPMWGPGEPNNLYNNDEDCVLIDSTSRRWQDDGSTVWKDYPCCSGHQVSAVFCEKSTNSSGEPLNIDDFSNPLAEACFRERDECLSNPCTQGGLCEDRFLDYHCVCPMGLTGKHCESDVHCPAVPIWSDYNISSKDTIYRSVINYTCADEEYKFADEAPYKTAECNATGLWEPAFENCAIPEKEHKPIARKYTRPTEATGAPAFGSIAIIFMIAELSFFIFLDMDYFVREVGPLCAAPFRACRRKITDYEQGSQRQGDGSSEEGGGGSSRLVCCAPRVSRYVITEEAEAQPCSSTGPLEYQMENGSIDSKF